MLTTMEIEDMQVKNFMETINYFYNNNLVTERSDFKVTVKADSENIFKHRVEDVSETLLNDIDSKSGKNSSYWLAVLGTKLLMLHTFCKERGIEVEFFYRNKSFLRLGNIPIE